MQISIKVIILDLGGTFFTNGTSIAMNKFAKMLKIPKNRIEYVLRGKEYGRAYRVGEIDARAFWEKVKKGLGIDSEKAKQLEFIWHSSYKPNKGMTALTKKLRKKYKVIVLSGNTPERVKYLNKKYSLDKLFDDYFYSFDYGVNKPNPLFFKIVLKKLKINPEKCLLIDDLKKVNNEAKKLGFETILFKNSTQLTKDLNKRGIL